MCAFLHAISESSMLYVHTHLQICFEMSNLLPRLQVGVLWHSVSPRNTWTISFSFHVLQILIQLFYLNFLCEAMFYTVSAPLNKASSAFPPSSCSLSFQSTSRAIEDTQLMISVSLCLRVSYFHVHGLHQLSLAAMTGIILIDTSLSYRPTLSPSHPQHPYHLRVYRS